jgi:hypothetical protein
MADSPCIKDSIGAASYEQLRNVVKAAFPATHADQSQVDDRFVDSLVRCMWRSYKPEYQQLGVPPIDELPPGHNATHTSTLEAENNALRAMLARKSQGEQLYWANARHSRSLKVNTDTPMASEFIGRLPKVRVSLPQTLRPGENDKITTSLGDVYFRTPDHKILDIASFTDKYQKKLGYAPKRMDLITPVRHLGTRFGAISLYLGYRNANDAQPSFYMLEGGTATGDAKMIYFGQTVQTTIERPSYYQPTPFSAVNNQYVGTLAMTQDGRHPSRVVVKSTQPGHQGNYITITMDYQPVPSIDPSWPALLTLQAAARVALIAETMGVKDAVPVQGVLALIGRLHYEWVTPPTLNPHK